MQKGVIDVRRRTRKLKPPLWVSERQQAVIGSSGDLETWIREVARPCLRSTRLMLMMSAAFAAPLLEIIGLQPFGLNVCGPSKVGKTTGLLVSTSVIGIGRESRLPNWNTTNASFQETARLFNDLVLAANEVGLLAGRKGEAYHRIRELIYVFAEGREKSRHSSSSAASSLKNACWRGIFVSTSEHSFSTYAAFSGAQRDHGEFARYLDVPAVRSSRPTILDRRPGTVPEDQFKEWSRRKLIAIREACEQNHGVAIQPYIRYLIAHDDVLETTVKSRVEEFEQAVNAARLDGALQHATKNFGLIYAGGCYGIGAELLPWSRERLLKAIVSCFKAAVYDLQAHDDAAAKARVVLRKKLVRADVARRKPTSTFGPTDHQGFVSKEKGSPVFTIHAKVFRSWFPNRAQLVAALHWLKDEGYLVLSGARIGAAGTNGTEWAERSPRWPSGQNARSVVFRDPFDGKARPKSLRRRST